MANVPKSLSNQVERITTLTEAAPHTPEHVLTLLLALAITARCRVLRPAIGLLFLTGRRLPFGQLRDVQLLNIHALRFQNTLQIAEAMTQKLGGLIV